MSVPLATRILRRTLIVSGAFLATLLSGACASAADIPQGKLVTQSFAAEPARPDCDYGFCKSFNVTARVETIAVVVWYVTGLDGCTSAGTGSFSTIVAPTHGEYRQIDDEPIFYTPCQKALPASLVLYTWTDSNKGASDDSFAVHYETDDQGLGESIGLDALLQDPPEIVLGDFPKACTDLIDNDHAVRLSFVMDEVGNMQARPMASFTPTGGLKAAARACGFDDFDWNQVLTASSYQIPNKHGFIKLPYMDDADPPFLYSLTLPADKYWALEHHKRSKVSNCPHGDYNPKDVKGDNVLCYTDWPSIDTSWNLGGTEQFTTSLIGVKTDETGKRIATKPLAQWIWLYAYYEPTFVKECQKEYKYEFNDSPLERLMYWYCESPWQQYPGKGFILNRSANVHVN